MTKIERQLLVTTALPYANGSLHLGYMLESIQADIWVRFQRLQGNTCYFICGDDAHGTPIMLLAERLGIKPEDLIQQFHKEHAQDLKDFGISLDNFHTTHSSENQALSSLIYKRLAAKGDITTRTIQQAFDPERKLFLPDRYVKGECPKCGAPDQYGDNCESCGATYSPTDLKNPVSAVSGATPIQKESEHYFFCLEHYQDFLNSWVHAGHLQVEITKKLDEWLQNGLEQWDISRDGPYFGFQIPDAPNKYFYVWLDAPIGYMASFKNFCDQQKNLSFDAFWKQDSQAELYHFIGKDIVYFHTLFWPAMLKGSDFRIPTNVFVHGFLTVNGEKMSKSRGTWIKARTYLNHFKPDYLRYYFAAKLGSSIEDIDFSNEDFVSRINADLVGKLVNIASRCAGFITKRFDGRLSETCSDPKLYERFVQEGNNLQHHFENRDFNKAVQHIMRLADEANRYIDAEKPWLLKKPEEQHTLHQICSLGLNLFKVLMTYLKPIVPELAQEAEVFLKTEFTWENRKTLLSSHEISPFKPLIKRLEIDEVTAMINEETQEPAKETKQEVPTITIDEFSKIDLRVAKVLEAEAVADAKKLIRFKLDLGDETRQVFSGIKEHYDPNDLIGKLVVVVANLAPRKMRFGLSEGMVLMTLGDDELWILEPNANAKPGMRIG